MGLPGGQDEHLARPQLASRPVGGEGDPPLQAVDRDLPTGMVGGDLPALREGQPPDFQRLCLRQRSTAPRAKQFPRCGRQ